MLIFLYFASTQVASAQPRMAYGWVEKVRIYPGNIVIHAKLDTGADSSSLDASTLEEFTKDGKKWVRFKVANRYGRKVTVEKEVHRTALVKRHAGKPQKRNVIRVGVCLGKAYMETDVSLVDRRNFDYQMLIGRGFLAGNALVDSAVAYTTDPKCEVNIPKKEIRIKKKKPKKEKVASTEQKTTEQKTDEKKTDVSAKIDSHVDTPSMSVSVEAQGL